MNTHETRQESERRFDAFCDRFVSRWDWYARQMADGSYVAVRRPLTRHLIAAHLRGEVTLGVYALNNESNGRWLCFDADAEDRWQRLLDLHARLEGDGVSSLLETSRRGGHLWLFFDCLLPGELIRNFGFGLVGRDSGLELYPKHDRLDGGPGSCVRLPLGVHRKDGRRYGFAGAVGDTLGAQFGALSAVGPVPITFVERVTALSTEPPRVAARSVRMDIPPGSGPVAEIKAGIDIHEFIGQYVRLTRTGRGHCPFHEDKHMSFSVRRDRGFWNCFAGCGGGDVIDFWERRRQITTAEAIQELRGISTTRLCHPEAPFGPAVGAGLRQSPE